MPRDDELSTLAETLELFPVAAALVVDTGSTLSVHAGNARFDATGAEAAIRGGQDILAARIRTFLASDAQTLDLAWTVGDEIDCRSFAVTLSRRPQTIGTPRCLIALIDHTSELRTEQSLRREMQTDSLTGLPNRPAFSDLIDAALSDPAERGRQAVLIVDLNRFNRVNACMGGLSGDELLISVARRIRGALRVTDALTRIGGDEFGILMQLDGGRGDAMQLAKRIRTALATPFRLSDFEVKIDCSVGIAFGSDPVGEAEELIRHAQFAVKRSKATGRTETYHPRAFDNLRERFGMETALRRALEQGAMRLSYQPICDLTTGRVTAFEALARWTDEHGVSHSPDEFIAVAEETGLIVPLGRWAIDAAAKTLAEWDARAGGDCGVQVAVNLSAVQLQRDSVVQVVETALVRHNIAGHRMKLELTESALVTDPDGTARVVRALKALGTSLAMDDFGTGYSNLAYLQQLPIEILKIDRSFVTEMLADRDKIAIVRAVLSLADALGMKTVAEGIETPELAQTLAALGCTFGQGYHFAKPLGADAAYRYLVDRNA